MQCYAGQKIIIRARATDPVTLHIITDATGTAFMYNPSKDPEHNPDDRVADSTISMTFDPASRYYLAAVDTTGYAPGDWTCKTLILGGEGDYDSWEYFTFEVLA